MIVSYATKDLRDSCIKREQADEVFGPTAARSLFRMLADAEAAESAAEFFSLYEGAIQIREGDSVSVNYAPECYVMFDLLSIQCKGSKSANWSSVRRLKLKQVQVHRNV